MLLKFHILKQPFPDVYKRQGYIHAIAHSLGGEYNVPHGLANAVILPMVLESYGESIYTCLLYTSPIYPLTVKAGLDIFLT